MSIEIIQDNILNTDKDIIVQQVNCKGVMGGGLARQIMTKYPEVVKEYKNYCRHRMKHAIHYNELLGEVLFVDTHDGKIIANVFGQVDIKKRFNDYTVYTNTEALIKGITHIRDKADRLNLSVAIPTFIGCGLANGDWNTIKPLIDNSFIGSSVDVVYYHKR